MSTKEKNDWVLKIVSVLAAVVLWLYASADVNPMMEKSFDVSIAYLNQAEDMLVLEGPKRVTLTIKGRQNDLLTLRSDDFWAGIDLQDAVKGTADYPIEIRVPENVERYTASASIAKVHLGQWESKTVPVKLETNGELSSSYQLNKTSLLPESVQIEGYSHILTDIWSVSTNPLDLSSLNNDWNGTVSLNLPEGVTAAKDKVQVKLDLLEVQRKREFELPVNVRNLPDGLKATMSNNRVSCLLKGTDKEFAAFNVEQIQLYVDCAGLSLGTHTLDIQMENNSKFSAVELAPVKVEVVIENAALSSMAEND